MKGERMGKRIIVSTFVLLVCIALPVLKHLADTKHEAYVISRAKNEPFQAHQIIPDLNLYLGSYPSSLQYDHLKNKNITHIVSVILAVSAPPLDPTFRDTFDYMVVKGFDRPSQVLVDHFEDLHKFIDEGLKKGGVLVHCMAGVSRSSTVVISYLMSRQNMTYEQAYKQVKSVRRIIQPNEGFVRQLKHYEKHLQQKTTKEILSDTLAPPLSAYAAEEKEEFWWSFFSTVIFSCESQGKDCVYIKGNFMIDFVQEMIIYINVLIYRLLHLEKLA